MPYPAAPTSPVDAHAAHGAPPAAGDHNHYNNEDDNGDSDEHNEHPRNSGDSGELRALPGSHHCAVDSMLCDVVEAALDSARTADGHFVLPRGGDRALPTYAGSTFSFTKSFSFLFSET